MFDLISPFDHRTSDLFRYFDDLGRDAAHNEGSAAPCRTDILEFDDRFELLAELPGFAKDEIHLDIDDLLAGACGGDAAQLEPMLGHRAAEPQLHPVVELELLHAALLSRISACRRAAPAHPRPRAAPAFPSHAASRTRAASFHRRDIIPLSQADAAPGCPTDARRPYPSR